MLGAVLTPLPPPPGALAPAPGFGWASALGAQANKARRPAAKLARSLRDAKDNMDGTHVRIAIRCWRSVSDQRVPGPANRQPLGGGTRVRPRGVGRTA